MIKVLAVSGGVDSMVMLDLMRSKYSAENLVLATFDHGTRENSSKDADFVDRIGNDLGIRVLRGKTELGAGASEEEAREKRYDFLHSVAHNVGGEIYTAHHLDDLVESVAINITRGTGFRGLAALNAPDVKRPFLDGSFGKIFSKHDILEYASKKSIVFRQDPTNTSDDYLRNRLRPSVSALSQETKNRLCELWQKQMKLTQEIDGITKEIIPESLKFERLWFMDLDDDAALEILRAGLLQANISATRPQIRNFLVAIRKYAPGKKFNLPGDTLVRINRKDFTLKV
ncbi:tRNA lysidine(34) synthetase TilS [Candidatus Saccharibacteria bacterium]|nr:tRNA lysidine(34) synthetase TilS [Candidatus Saccharibacteria bacterium]